MKRLKPNVIAALEECLCTLYWYKEDLLQFLRRAGVPRKIVGHLPGHLRKRQIVSELLDDLTANSATGTAVLNDLIGAVLEQTTTFPHLSRLEDGPTLVRKAKTAHESLKTVVGHTTAAELAEKAKAERRTEAQRQQSDLRARTTALAKIRARFQELFASTDPQGRGRLFEALLRDFFDLHDLEPKAGFATPGEQTDGSISLDGRIFLVEAKWTAEPTSPRQIKEMLGTLQGKLDNTLALFVSVNGFTDEAVKTAAKGDRITMILMDGVDLMLVLEGCHDLVELLRRKLRSAAELGNPLFRLSN